MWHVDYQDVIAIGKLFVTGKLFLDRVVALGGVGFKEVGLIETRQGACLEDLTRGNVKLGEYRLISGSVLCGREAKGSFNYLGKYHQIISAIEENRDRIFQGFLKPGLNAFSLKRVFLAAFLKPFKQFNFTSSSEGSKRDMVPIGLYEKVMPLRILSTFLLRALLAKDDEQAEKLGALELDGEDVSLCSFVCQSKQDYGDELKKMHERLLKELE